MKVMGQKISRLWTIGSFYANGYIDAVVDVEGREQVARIHVSTITKMLNEFKFEGVNPSKHLQSILDLQYGTIYISCPA